MEQSNGLSVSTQRRRARHRREDYHKRREAAAPPSFGGVARLWQKAAELGGIAVGLTGMLWDAAGYCEHPLTISRIGLARETNPKLNGSLRVEMQVPCRTCDACLRRRAAIYRHAAEAEIAGSPLTLMGTLTFNEELQLRFLTQARLRVAADGVDFDALSLERQFELRVSYARPCFTRLMKVIRARMPSPVKNGKALPNYRFLLVAEPHGEAASNDEDTRPHFHVLLHIIHRDFTPRTTTKLVADKFVKDALYAVEEYTCLEDKWIFGHSRWRVADKSAAFYVTDYLRKDRRSKVGHSETYGEFDYDLHKLS